MSYILDALKRSEQDRQQERAASVTNDMMILSAKQQRPSFWPYLLVIVLLVNALVIFYITQEKQNDLADKAPVELSNEAAPASPTNPINDKAQRSRALPEHVIKPVASPERIVQQKQSAFTKPLNDTSGERVKEYTDDGAEIIRPKSKSLTASVQTSKQSLMSDYDAIERSQPEDSSTAKYSDETHESISEPVVDDPFEDIPHLGDLQLGFQRQVPDLAFSSHIYSANPSARRAMINSHYLREGQGFSGLTLVEIGEFFILFEKNGTQFKLPALRDWNAP